MKSIAVFIFCLLFSSFAAASVINFAGVESQGGFASSYDEAGVVADGIGGIVAFHQNSGKIHLADSATAFATGVSFSMSGRFDAVQFDLRGFTNYCSYANWPCLGVDAFDNVEVIGVRDNVAVANELFFSGVTEASHSLGALFSNLDSLIINILLPSDLQNSNCAITPTCSSFDIDNLVLKPVDVAQTPLPAGLPLYGAGLVILSLLGFKRRKAKHSS